MTTPARPRHVPKLHVVYVNGITLKIPLHTPGFITIGYQYLGKAPALHEALTLRPQQIKALMDAGWHRPDPDRDPWIVRELIGCDQSFASRILVREGLWMDTAVAEWEKTTRTATKIDPIFPGGDLYTVPHWFVYWFEGEWKFYGPCLGRLNWFWNDKEGK